jgi:glycosyltransferase involved in cell wall biosynthesis
MKPSVSIIVPAYNESASVEDTLRQLLSVCASCTEAFEIIAVNDCSTDGSEKVLDGLVSEQIKAIHHPSNRGYGASLKTGIRAAIHPWILITDADGTYPISRIPDLLIQTRDHDMVVGARIGDNVHDTIPRRVGRWIIRAFASYIADADIKDINSGLRVFKKTDAELFWHLFPERFSFTSTITVAEHTRGLSVAYLPIDYYKRSGKSSIKPAKDFVGFLSLLTRLAIYFKPLKVFVPISVGLLLLAISALVVSWLWLPRILDSTFAILAIASLQTLFFGLVAEMIVKRFYRE